MTDPVYAKMPAGHVVKIEGTAPAVPIGASVSTEKEWMRDNDPPIPARRGFDDDAVKKWLEDSRRGGGRTDA